MNSNDLSTQALEPPPPPPRVAPIEDPIEDGRLFGGLSLTELRAIGTGQQTSVVAIMLSDQIHRYETIQQVMRKMRPLVEEAYRPLITIYQQVLQALGAHRNASYLDIDQHHMADKRPGHWHVLIDGVSGTITSVEFHRLLSAVRDSAQYDLGFHAKLIASPLTHTLDKLHHLERLSHNLLGAPQNIEGLSDQQMHEVYMEFYAYLAEVSDILCDLYWTMDASSEDVHTVQQVTFEAINLANATCPWFATRSPAERKKVIEKLIREAVSDESLLSMSTPHYQEAWARIVHLPLVGYMNQILDSFDRLVLIRNAIRVILQHVLRHKDFVNEPDVDYGNSITSRVYAGKHKSLRPFCPHPEEDDEEDDTLLDALSRNQAPESKENEMDISRVVLGQAVDWDNINFWQANGFGLPPFDLVQDPDDDQAYYRATLEWAKGLPVHWTTGASFRQLGEVLDAVMQCYHLLLAEFAQEDSHNILSEIAVQTCTALFNMGCFPLDAALFEDFNWAVWLHTEQAGSFITEWVADFDKYMLPKVEPTQPPANFKQKSNPKWTNAIPGTGDGAQSFKNLTPAQKLQVLVNWAKSLDDYWLNHASVYDLGWLQFDLSHVIIQDMGSDEDRCLLAMRMAQCLRKIEKTLWITNAPITTKWVLDNVEGDERLQAWAERYEFR